jgi:hypothetical protein
VARRKTLKNNVYRHALLGPDRSARRKAADQIVRLAELGDIPLAFDRHSDIVSPTWSVETPSQPPPQDQQTDLLLLVRRQARSAGSP